MELPEAGPCAAACCALVAMLTWRVLAVQVLQVGAVWCLRAVQGFVIEVASRVRRAKSYLMHEFCAWTGGGMDGSSGGATCYATTDSMMGLHLRSTHHTVAC